MTTRRYYANAAPQRTLSGSLTSSASSLAVSGTFAGWPTQFPFYATLDIGTASAEIVLVTAVASSTATIVRGQDGTAAITHAAGATFDQTVVRQDFDEASAHTSANAGVHGASGSVVGTTDSQTLTNKTLASPIVTGTLAGATQTLSGTLTVTGDVTANGAGTGLAVANNATVGGTLASGAHTATAPAAAALAVTAKPQAAGVVLNVRNIADSANTFSVTDTGVVEAAGGIIDDTFVWSGTASFGTFNAAKPKKVKQVRVTGTTDGTNGLISAPIGATATWIGFVGIDRWLGTDGTVFVIHRNDLDSATTVQFQTRLNSTGAGAISKAVDFVAEINYQV